MKLITSMYDNKSQIKIHDNMFDLLFKHKSLISNRLSDIKGIYNIDHFAIHIIEPNKVESVFSTTPSVEYNVIYQNLWHFDNCFAPKEIKDNELFWWDEGFAKESYSVLKRIKLDNHGFSKGFGIVRKIDNFTIVFSFATRSSALNLKEYYSQIFLDLSQIGEYGYKLLYDLYQHYCTAEPPKFENPRLTRKNKHLRLIVNANYKKSIDYV